MKYNRLCALFFGILITCFANATTIFARTQIILYGDNLGRAYDPANVTVSVGDTIIWQGSQNADFTQYDLISVKVPAGADAIPLVNTGKTYTYIIRIAGEYDYQSKTWASVGMTGK